ncbi:MULTISPECIES: hypothetical protein [Rhodococcus]|uniref:hypothetical protein n=1 Tax=Rhodococcus TaxID=1827 RepID=UPI001E5607F1|nr:hypothetical protein [Rhodococcus pyridinivorans]MCD2116107.1 hypothetical protein [Rhodococcus pyridinivorans]MCZ4624974.1 hypothetical protein [Rhodococcus pyridinivorans]MCZ4646507.1 hypothetical protein [Rhodococcus pyridinivorans]MDJ0482690.1 hypothetical protein [Rhodococcus pyridinivorans]MDV7252286.1 hypothetical protein [Rhodococcus pyridinivorans]
MSVGVGLRVGTTVSSVAVTSPTPGRPDPAPIERFTAVHLHSDGTATLGDHDVVDGHTSSFTGFVDRLGHSGGVRANDGSLSRAEDLVATAMECLLADAASLIGDTPYTAVATHPTDWPSSTVAVLRNALDYVGLRHVSLVSDAEAAAAWFESQVAHQTGRLLAVYHIDPQGSTVTLVRSGVAAGKAFRFPEDDAPSVAAQLSSALGAFGWLVSNLDAIVVTIDEAVDPSAAQLVAQSVKTGLGVRCALAPAPHQTMVRGAALAAAAGSVDLLGSTQILPTAKLTEPRRSELDPEITAVISKITATPPPGATPAAAAANTPKATVAAVAAGDAADEKPSGRSSKVTAIAVAAAIALLVGVGALVFGLRDSPTATAGTQVAETPTAPATTTTSKSSKPPAPRSTEETTTEESTEPATAEQAVPVAPPVVQQTWVDPTTGTSEQSSSSSSPGSTTSSTSSTTSSTGWSRRNQPDDSSGGGRGSGGSGGSGGSTTTTTTQPTTAPTDPDPSEEPPSPDIPGTTETETGS